MNIKDPSPITWRDFHPFRVIWLSALVYTSIIIYEEHGAAALVMFIPMLAEIWIQMEKLWFGEGKTGQLDRR